MTNKNNDFFRANINELKKAEKAFSIGDISIKEYKAILGKFGVCFQKGGKSGMVRLRLCGGHVDKDKLSFILDIIHKYSIDYVHITTGETIQLHNLSIESMIDIISLALDHDINTQGVGGDNPRNILVTSLSGVEPKENFDVYPYAKAAEQYLLDIMYDIQMPRKLKIAFSSSNKNETHATFRDLGFVQLSNGKFDVWSGGGLGNNPSMGVIVGRNIDPSKTLYYIRAMIDIFIKHGNYSNRKRARTRYIKEDLGCSNYTTEFNNALNQLLKSDGMDINPQQMEFPKKLFKQVSGNRIFKQKQGGLYYVAYHPIGGCVQIDVLERIHKAISDINGAELRISPDSTIYIINLDGNEALYVSDMTEGGANTLFESSVSCVGSKICQIGLRDSNGILLKMIDAIRQAGLPMELLPRFRISGCGSSCSAHQIGNVGMYGGTKVVGGNPIPVFNILINGCGLQGMERFGDNIGAVPVDSVPNMIVHLVQTIVSSGMSFDEWLSMHSIKDSIGEYLI